MGLCLERIVTARGPVRWRFGKTGRCGGFAELGTRVEPVGRWRSSGRTRFRGRVVWMRLGAGRVQAPRRSVSSSGTATGIGNGYGLGWNRPRSTGSQRPLRDGHVRQRVAGRRRLRPPSKSGILDSSCLSNHFFFQLSVETPLDDERSQNTEQKGKKEFSKWLLLLQMFVKNQDGGGSQLSSWAPWSTQRKQLWLAASKDWLFQQFLSTDNRKISSSSSSSNKVPVWN